MSVQFIINLIKFVTLRIVGHCEKASATKYQHYALLPRLNNLDEYDYTEFKKKIHQKVSTPNWADPNNLSNNLGN